MNNAAALAAERFKSAKATTQAMSASNAAHDARVSINLVIKHIEIIVTKHPLLKETEQYAIVQGVLHEAQPLAEKLSQLVDDLADHTRYIDDFGRK